MFYCGLSNITLEKEKNICVFSCVPTVGHKLFECLILIIQLGHYGIETFVVLDLLLLLMTNSHNNEKLGGAPVE